MQDKLLVNFKKFWMFQISKLNKKIYFKSSYGSD